MDSQVKGWKATGEIFTAAERVAAQKALDLYPDNSAYWDSVAGQETLECARLVGLKATNTNRERCARYRELIDSMQSA